MLFRSGAQAIEVSEHTFGGEYNETLVHQAVVAYMAGGRQGSKQQKTRSDVSGGGKRPWRQKGTGRARAGTIRSPIWRGGGTTFAARPQDHSQKLNKKMYRAALRSILAELVRSERLIVVEDFTVEAPKTKDLLAKLNGMGLTDVLIVSDAVDQNLYLAARNLPPQLQKKAILWGTVGAIAVRSVMTLGVVWLLKIPGLMLIGGLVCGLGAVGCALAPSIGWLVAARVVQGLGGGIAIPHCRSAAVNTNTLAFARLSPGARPDTSPQSV